jgi:hypothetical protein
VTLEVANIAIPFLPVYSYWMQANLDFIFLAVPTYKTMLLAWFLGSSSLKGDSGIH